VLPKDNPSYGNTTHGMYHTAEHGVWSGIKERCRNPKNTNYHRYGGRGIDICDRWFNSFEDFYTDMGNRPTKNHSIERRNNNLGYFKENCYWATIQQQSYNKRSSRCIIFIRVHMILKDFAMKLNINHTAIINYIRRNGIEKAHEYYKWDKGSYYTKSS